MGFGVVWARVGGGGGEWGGGDGRQVLACPSTTRVWHPCGLDALPHPQSYQMLLLPASRPSPVKVKVWSRFDMELQEFRAGRAARRIVGFLGPHPPVLLADHSLHLPQVRSARVVRSHDQVPGARYHTRAGTADDSQQLEGDVSGAQCGARAGGGARGRGSAPGLRSARCSPLQVALCRGLFLHRLHHDQGGAGGDRYVSPAQHKGLADCVRAVRVAGRWASSGGLQPQGPLRST